MPGLLEASASLALSGAVLALVSASMTATVRLQTACIALGDELFRERQLEHLVDRVVLASGSGPALPGAVTSVSADTVVFAADHNGDGVVDPSSSETSALEVRESSGDARVRLRLGRQTMTVLEAKDSVATLRILDTGGADTTASGASLVELTIAQSNADGPVRRMLFAIPRSAAP